MELTFRDTFPDIASENEPYWKLCVDSVSSPQDLDHLEDICIISACSKIKNAVSIPKTCGEAVNAVEMFFGEIEPGPYKANLTRCTDLLYVIVSPPGFVVFSLAACNLVLQYLKR